MKSSRARCRGSGEPGTTATRSCAAPRPRSSRRSRCPTSAAERLILDHVHLHVADAERAARFYRDALGAREAFRAGERLVFMALPAGGIVALDARPEGERNPPHVGLALPEDADLDTAVDAAVRAGGTLLDVGEHAPGVPYAYVADPDGNVLEL